MIEQLVIEGVADMLGRDAGEVCRDDHLAEDLGVDELDLLNIVCEIETRAGIELPSTAESAMTVADLIAAAAREVESGQPTTLPLAPRGEGEEPPRRRRGGRGRRRKTPAELAQ